MNAPWQSADAVGVPKTGFPAETMARDAADHTFGDFPAVYILDAGNDGVVILGDRMLPPREVLPPRKHGVMIPGPQSYAAKPAFEKHFLRETRDGYVRPP